MLVDKVRRGSYMVPLTSAPPPSLEAACWSTRWGSDAAALPLPYKRTSTCFLPKSNMLRPLSSLTPSLLIALSSLLPTPGVRLPHSVQQVVDQRVEERAGGGLGEIG